MIVAVANKMLVHLRVVQHIGTFRPIFRKFVNQILQSSVDLGGLICLFQKKAVGKKCTNLPECMDTNR